MRTTAFKTHTQLKQTKQPSVNVEIIHIKINLPCVKAEIIHRQRRLPDVILKCLQQNIMVLSFQHNATNYNFYLLFQLKTLISQILDFLY